MPIHFSTIPASASEQRREPIADTSNPNVVIFGETGVGKSSIINLIAGQKLAQTSSDATGCTRQHQRYIVTLDGVPYALWDTVGLNHGAGSAGLAESDLKALIQELAQSGGIHLAMYCIRGSRFTDATKRNYDKFCAAVHPKRVPVALIVTGLEHQQGEMETWWATNTATLRQYGMRSDAHACVTTLDAEDDVVQQRRFDSQRLLRELAVRYSRNPARKTGSSSMWSVFPIFTTVFRGTMAARRAKKSITTVRRVITCDMASSSDISTPVPIRVSSDMTTLRGTRTEWVQIEGRQYEFVHVDKRALQIHTAHEVQLPRASTGAGLGGRVLVFYTSPLGNSIIPPAEVDMLEVFYEIAGGQTCPVIVVLRGCDDEERATRECRNAVASCHKNIQAYPTTLSSQKLTELIERLYIERIEVKTSGVRRVSATIKNCLVTAAEVAADFILHRRRHERKVTPGVSRVT